LCGEQAVVSANSLNNANGKALVTCLSVPMLFRQKPITPSRGSLGTVVHLPMGCLPVGSAIVTPTGFWLPLSDGDTIPRGPKSLFPTHVEQQGAGEASTGWRSGCQVHTVDFSSLPLSGIGLGYK
jgi:hypothetical protein